MNNENNNLRDKTKRHFARLTVMNGVRTILASHKTIIKTLIILLGVRWFILLISLTQSEYVEGIYRLCAAILPLFAAVFVAYYYGRVPGGKRIYDDFVRVGFVNSAGEAPVLIEKTIDGNITVYTFFSKGICLDRWRERVEIVQSALNMTVGSIKPGQDYRTVVISAVDPSMVLGKMIMWKNEYIDKDNPELFVLGMKVSGELVTVDIDKMPMILIGGSTGSGKTKLAIILLLQAIARGAYVYILDFKGLDYYMLEQRDAGIITTPDTACQMLQQIIIRMYKRIEMFKASHAVNLSDYNRKTGNNMNRIFVLVDECAMLTDFGTSKSEKQLAADCIDKLAALARMGRAVGIHLIISTQRPDMNAVPGAIKSNLDCRICGKADSTLSTIILGDGRADTLIPKDSQGRFVMADGAEDIVFQAFFYDGQE